MKKSLIILAMILTTTGLFAGFHVSALSISGANKVCSSATSNYTISGLPAGTTRWTYATDFGTLPHFESSKGCH